MAWEHWIDIGTLIGVVGSFLSILLAAYYFWIDSRHRRKKDTLEFFETTYVRLKDEKQKLTNETIEHLHQGNFEQIIKDKDVFARVSTLLNLLERLGVSVHEGVFEIGTLNRLFGGILISEWSTFAGFVEFYREDKESPKAWIEFQKLAEAIETMRTRKIKMKVIEPGHWLRSVGKRY